MTNKPVSDAYTCNYCEAELIGAAEYCSPKCKINYLQSEMDRLRAELAEQKTFKDEWRECAKSRAVELDAARALLRQFQISETHRRGDWSRIARLQKKITALLGENKGDNR